MKKILLILIFCAIIIGYVLLNDFGFFKTEETAVEKQGDQAVKNQTGESQTRETSTKTDTPSDILLEKPESDSIVSNPIKIKGQAVGNWFFEGTAPVVLTDWDGEIISEGNIRAKENWMSENLIPFEGEISFEEPEDIGDYSDKGSLIIQKANPSGLPKNDAAKEIQIFFRD